MSMTLAEAKLAWQDDRLTDLGLYDACKTDLQFYNILTESGLDEESVKERMREVSGSDDAYCNALSEAEADSEDEDDKSKYEEGHGDALDDMIKLYDIISNATDNFNAFTLERYGVCYTQSTADVISKVIADYPLKDLLDDYKNWMESKSSYQVGDVVLVEDESDISIVMDANDSIRVAMVYQIGGGRRCVRYNKLKKTDQIYGEVCELAQLVDKLKAISEESDII